MYMYRLICILRGDIHGFFASRKVHEAKISLSLILTYVIVTRNIQLITLNALAWQIRHVELNFFK